MKGLGRKHFWAVPGFAEAMLTCEPNYPERLKHIFIIRAPWIFGSLYALVKPVMEPGTVKKVVILGDNFMPTLLKYMPEETIPEYLGGGGRIDHISPGGDVPKGAFEKMKKTGV